MIAKLAMENAMKPDSPTAKNSYTIQGISKDPKDPMAKQRLNPKLLIFEGYN